MIDIRDENFRGIGTELGLTVSGGARNGFARLEFKSNRLFSRYFTYNLSGFLSVYNSYVYGDAPIETGRNRWDRDLLGEYSDIRLGGRLIIGTQLERLGNATIEWYVGRAKHVSSTSDAWLGGCNNAARPAISARGPRVNVWDT